MIEFVLLAAGLFAGFIGGVLWVCARDHGEEPRPWPPPREAPDIDS